MNKYTCRPHLRGSRLTRGEPLVDIPCRRCDPSKRAIHSRYFRKVIAYPEGAIVHHGDCWVFSTGVCTCGLLHDLLVIPKPERLYPRYLKEQGKQWYALHILSELQSKGKLQQRPPTKAQDRQARKMMDELFGKHKRGGRFGRKS